MSVTGAFTVFLQLAQDAPRRQWTDQDSIRLVEIIGAFIVAVVALGMILLFIRKKMLAAESEMAAHRTLMDELRALHASGKMSDAEYDAARKKLAARIAGQIKSAPVGDTGRSYGAKIPRDAMPPPASAARVAARPGHDLTGQPLPKPDGSEPKA